GRFTPRGQGALARRPDGRVDVACNRPVRDAEGVGREMNRRSLTRGVAWLAAWTVLGAACSSAGRSGRELVAVSLPDLSGAAAPVQRQIRDEYAALTRQAASASAAERVDAY